MGDVQISRFTIPVELLFFSWLEIRNKTGLACSKELPPGTPKPQGPIPPSYHPYPGMTKFTFWDGAPSTTPSGCVPNRWRFGCIMLHPYKNWKSVTVFFYTSFLQLSYLLLVSGDVCLGSHIPVTASPGPIWLQRGSAVPGGDSVSEAGKLRYWAIHSQIPIVDWLWNRGIIYDCIQYVNAWLGKFKYNIV